MYGGVAPNAKICFMDLAPPNSGLTMPSPIKLLWSVGYTCGARAQSNSFGAPFSNTKGFYAAADVDAFLAQNPVRTVPAWFDWSVNATLRL